MSAGLADPDAPVAPPEPPRLQVRQVGGERSWTLSRHADIQAVLRSPAFGVVSVDEAIRRIAQRAGRDYSALLALLRGNTLFQRGERHQATRRRLRQVIEEMGARWPAARLEAAARGIVAALPPEGEDVVLDVVPALAEPLGTLVLGEALELPAPLCLDLQKRALAVTGSWISLHALRELDRLEAEAVELRALLRAQLKPGRGIARLGPDGGEDALDHAAGFLMAASHTVSSTIAAALDVLARQPGWQARLRERPALSAGFIREILRLAGPVRRLNRRVALAEARIGDALIRPGDIIVLPVDRAHRDAAAFPDPDALDPGRKGAGLLAFGGGAHACPGAVLGAQEAEAMVRAVLERFTLQPAEARGALEPHEDLRGFHALPLRLRRLAGASATASDPRLTTPTGSPMAAPAPQDDCPE